MADREVTATGKDSDGDITSLCNSGEDWSPRSKVDAINDITSGVHRYHVGSGVDRVEVIVVPDADGRLHLRTTGDDTTTNNLDELPDC